MIHDARKIKLHNDVVRNDIVHCPEYKLNIWRISLYKFFLKTNLARGLYPIKVFITSLNITFYNNFLTLRIVL